MAQLVSPKTGELISVNSEEFSDLLADPKYRRTILSSSVQTQMQTQPITPSTASVSASGTPPSPSSSLQGHPLPLSKTLPPLSPRLSSNNSINKLPPLSSNLSNNSKFATIPTLEETLKHTTQPSKREKLENMNAEDRRGIKTRGWSGRKPTRGKERHQLMQECGKECFLLPEQEKFPICQSPRMTGGVSNCTVDCGGVQSAYIRAHQYKYEDVAEKAKALLKECNEEGLKHFIPSQTSPQLSSPQMPSSAMRAGRRNDEPHDIEYNWEEKERGRSHKRDEREYNWEKNPDRKRDMEYMARQRRGK